MTDAPSQEIASLVVTIDGLSMIGDVGTISVTLPGGTVTTDLARLDGVSSLLAQATIPAGKYDTVLLSIANPGTVVWADGTTQSLTVANGQLSLSFGPTVVVSGGSSVPVKLDVDLGRSVKILTTAPGGVLLRPVVSASAGADAALSLDGAADVEPQTGTIVTIDPVAGLLELRTAGNETWACITTATTVIRGGDGALLTLASLAAGDQVNVEGSLAATGELVVATLDREDPPSSGDTAVRGRIVSIDRAGGTFVLAFQGATVTVGFSAGTTVVGVGKTLAVSDLAVGQAVKVMGTAGATVGARTIRIREEHFFATVAGPPDATARTVEVAGLPRAAFAATSGPLSVLIDALVDDQGGVQPIASLTVGQQVRVLGRLAPRTPDPADPRETFIAARLVIELPAAPVRGIVTAVDTTNNTLSLLVDAAEALAVDGAGTDVPLVVTVDVTPATVFGSGLAPDSSIIGSGVLVHGTFVRTTAPEWRLAALSVQPDPAAAPPSIYGQPCHSGNSTIIFLVDISGSMYDGVASFTDYLGVVRNGDKLDRAKSAVQGAIASLPSSFRFNIIPFDCSTYAWQPSLVTATPQNRQDAITWTDLLQPQGATGIGPATVTAFGDPANELIVLLTDGWPNCGAGDGWGDPACVAAHRDLIRTSNVHGVRIDVFGVGADPTGIQFCKDVAADNGGTFTPVQ